MASRVFQSNFTRSKILELWRDTSALKGAFEAGDLPTVATKLQATLHLLENARLDIGITGGTGSGKSTFDPRLAYTGVVEMSVDPTPYAHPKYPNVVIWDLPGIDTPTFQAKKYLQQVLLDRYNFLLLITLESFTAHRTQLACEILQQGKCFYFIRSKVDVDIVASCSRRPSTFSEERALSQTREDCWQWLEVFRLSMFELGKYDFDLLEELMVKELNSHKRHAFLLAMPNISKPILEQKAASLQQHLWLVATVACGVNPSPVPVVQDVVCDPCMLINSLEGYCHSFGLDKDSLIMLAEQTGQPWHKILEAVQGLKTKVTEALVVKLLGQASRDASAFTQELLNMPVLGTLVTCGISFATIYQMLRTSQDKVIKDAQKVLT
ncbi:unnamed protein product [Nyctereutes procyonoides]|uniref:(raccoon dog) hypothetical protein n=1 Tax=Nyctereutes procyonoides TaxID=34880 RepID=A0A811ZTQ7_NYCPR|nr:unnamed protein product [Nyctereutes procyonoides]